MERLKKERQELIVMLVIAALGLLLYFVVIPAEVPLSSAWGSDIEFSSRTFPNFIAVAMAITGVICALPRLVNVVKLRKELGAQQAEKKPKRTTEEIKVALIPYAIFAVCVAYAILFNTVGYLISTLLATTAILFLLRCRKLKFYLITYAFCLLLYVVFKLVLHVPLP